MVLANGASRARTVIGVKFAGRNMEGVKGLGVGSAVVVYVASVRASAKVVAVAAGDRQHKAARSGGVQDDDEDSAFGFGFDDEDVDNLGDKDEGVDDSTIVTFQFIASREFVELGSQVLVIPGGGPGLYGGTERGEKGVAGLEGFVGRVVEGFG